MKPQLKFYAILLLIAIYTNLSTAVFAQRSVNINAVEKRGVAANKDESDIIDKAITDVAKQYRVINLNPALQRDKTIKQGDTIVLDLFNDASYKAVVEKTYTNDENTLITRAKLVGLEYSYFILTTHNSKSYMTLFVDDKQENFRINYDHTSDKYVLSELDNTKVIALEDTELPTAEDIYDSVTSLQTNAVYNENYTGEQDTITLLIAYTPAARDYANTHSTGIENMIATIMDKSNLVLDNSKTHATLKLVHTMLVDYTEQNSSNDLYNFMNVNDGYMDSIHIERDKYKADLMHFLAYVSYTGGQAFYPSFGSINARLYGCALTRVQQAGWTYTVIHEIGHNLGCGHHREQNYQAGPGIKPYAAGWRWTNNTRKYCSVMPYEGGGYYADGVSHSRVPYFSNPDVQHLGINTGQSEYADNARMIRESKIIVSDYYYEKKPSVICGNNNIYSKVNTMTNRRAQRVVVGNTGGVQEVTMYHNAGVGNVQVAIYGSNGVYPGERLAVSEKTPLNEEQGWQTIKLEDTCMVKAGEVIWLAWMFDQNPGVRYEDDINSVRMSSNGIWTDGMPENFGYSVSANIAYSIYATVNPNILSIPEAIQVVATENKNVRISWNPSLRNYAKYEIERSQEPSSGFRQIANINTTIFIDHEIECNTTYYYRLRAVNEHGHSKYSHVVSITTKKQADLVATEMMAHNLGDYVVQSDQVSIFCNVANKGETVSASTTVFFYYSSDTIFDFEEDYFISKTQIPDIKPGKDYFCGQNFFFPQKIPTKQYYVFSVIDSENIVDELFENNNNAYSELCVVNITSSEYLGYDNVFFNENILSNRRAQQVVVLGKGSIKELSMYHKGGDGNMQLAVYDDDNDTPGKQIGITGVASISETDGWQTLALLDSIFVETDQKIWLAWVYDKNPGIMYRKGNALRASSSENWLAGMPETFGKSTTGYYTYSIYATIRRDVPYPVLDVKIYGYDNHNTIAWKPVCAIKDYYNYDYYEFLELERSTSANDSFKVIAGFNSCEIQYEDFNIENNTTYYYRLRTKNGEEFSKYTDIVSVTTRMFEPVAPDYEITQNYVNSSFVDDLTRLQISFTIKNVGTHHAANVCSVTFFISKDSIPDANDYYEEFTNYNSTHYNYIYNGLGINDRIWAVHRFLAATIENGEYYLITVLDYHNSLSELSKENNIAYNKIRIATDYIGDIGNKRWYPQINYASYLKAQQVSVDISGIIKDISLYKTEGEGKVQVAVYENNGSSPGERLACSEVTQLTLKDGWQTISLKTPLLVEEGEFIWLAWLFDGNQGIRYQSGGETRASSNIKWTGNIPEEFGYSTNAQFTYAVYASVYEPENATIKCENADNSGENFTNDEMPDFEFDARVFPNPFTNELNVEFDVSLNNSYVSVRLLNEDGKQQATIFNDVLPKGLHTIAIDEFIVNEYAATPGMYILQVIINNKNVNTIVLKK